ncbi:MAG: aminotransferase class V-fold PLP-dependent enzyme [Phycisphaeraceae bacterium]|nr:aminotransferase class V-fold PLP-dependent enzyme [Phycisphaeraceae bacterium]
MPTATRTDNPLRRHWTLDPDIAFLNHGSFGACPKAVLNAQAGWRSRMEREPVRFFVRDLEGLFDATRAALGAFVGADADDLCLVPNTTAAVNTVFRSLPIEPGDELLTTTHEYNACNNVLNFTAERTGARVVRAAIPFPIASPEEAVEAVLACVTDRTRYALIDWVTSATALVLPIMRIVGALRERGVETFVDGAHAPGMVDVDLGGLGAAFSAGNCHKWMCCPKGSAFLHVRKDWQDRVRPLAISHGANSPRTDRSRFRVEADWTGTADHSAALSIPAAIGFFEELIDGGWAEVRRRNRALALEGRRVLCGALGIDPPAPENMVGSIATIPVADSATGRPPSSPLYEDPLQDALIERFGVQVPVIPWPAPPRRVLRISAHVYNAPWEYERLASALRELRAEPGGESL